MDTLTLDGTSLVVSDVARIARSSGDPVVTLDEASATEMNKTVALRREFIELGIPIYGVTTGFGDSSTQQIGYAKAADLQHNLIRYHLNGTGQIATAEVARATMIIRANCLARGSSAIRPEVLQALLTHLSQGILPRIPEQGSLGASGDLVPLCYLAAALLGEGEVYHRGQARPALDALREEDIEPLTLEAKEGLALINGTAFSTAFAALALADAENLAYVAELSTAMACEALRGNSSHFGEFIHENKPHPGQVQSAVRIAALLQGSQLTTSYQEMLDSHSAVGEQGFASRDALQDRYSVRCAPQVIGVLRDQLEWASRWVNIEMNSATDNPLFDVRTGSIHHGGNFYAGHVGQAMDSLKVAVANIADLLDRQLELTVDEKFNNGLTPNLIPRVADQEWAAGLHHGFKGMQIAASSITAEAMRNSTPATIFSRSTEAHNQDKVSMGTLAARDARTVVELTQSVAAIHLLALAQAIDLRGVELASPAVRRAHGLIRQCAPFVDSDRRMDQDIHAVVQVIRTGQLRQVVEAEEAHSTGSL